MKLSPTLRVAARAALVVAACMALPAPAVCAQETAPDPVVPAPTGTAAESKSTTPDVRPDADADAVERRARRERAAKEAGTDSVLLVLGAGSSKGFTGRVRNDDFHYLCPFEATDGAILVYHDADTIRHVAYTQRRLKQTELWEGPTVGPGAETAARFDLDDARPVAQLATDLVVLLTQRSTLFVSANAPSDGAARLDALLVEVRAGLAPPRTLLRRDRGGRRRGERAVEPEDAVLVESANALLTGLRAVKSESEVARIRHAVEATVAGLNDAGRCIAPGLAEYQIQAVIEFHCKKAGCERQAFGSIVGSGPFSCVLHYMANRRVMQAGDMVVVDVGGEFEGYAADVTRTFPVSGTFTERQAEVYDAVLEAQRAGVAAVRPGVTHGQVHAAARAVLAKHGLDRWFLHGTSHSVGLNVHDAWSRERKLEIGSVLTVEPGVYIADEELGIRIEDTVLVTADGPVILSAGVPKDREAIEALMAQQSPFELTPPR